MKSADKFMNLKKEPEATGVEKYIQITNQWETQL
jgi:hypothetical protein